MSLQCYTPRASLRSTMTGGLFISPNGTRRVIPDHWLVQAELLQGSRLLRLTYSFCIVEVAGQCLDPIFEDAGTSKLGAVQAASSQSAPGDQLRVTSIVITPRTTESASSFERGDFDA